MSIRQSFSNFFYRLLGCAKLVKNIQLVPYKYTNEHLVASYSNTSLAEKYGFIPPAHKVEFGEIVDMLLVDDSIQIIGNHEEDFIRYKGKVYARNDFPKLATLIYNKNIKETLKVLK